MIRRICLLKTNGANQHLAFPHSDKALHSKKSHNVSVSQVKRSPSHKKHGQISLIPWGHRECNLKIIGCSADVHSMSLNFFSVSPRNVASIVTITNSMSNWEYNLPQDWLMAIEKIAHAQNFPPWLVSSGRGKQIGYYISLKHTNLLLVAELLIQ